MKINGHLLRNSDQSADKALPGFVNSEMGMKGRSKFGEENSFRKKGRCGATHGIERWWADLAMSLHSLSLWSQGDIIPRIKEYFCLSQPCFLSCSDTLCWLQCNTFCSAWVSTAARIRLQWHFVRQNTKKTLKTNYRKYPKKSIQAVCQSLGHHLSREAGWAMWPSAGCPAVAIIVKPQCSESEPSHAVLYWPFPSSARFRNVLTSVFFNATV